MKKLLFSLIVCALSNLSVAQNSNVVLRSHLAIPGQTLANICGYTDETGKEYALLGAAAGMIIVDVTDPDNPVQITQITGPTNLWKEIKVYHDYAYVTSEGGQGMQIVDLTGLPSTASFPSKFWTPTGDGCTINTIHALHIDTTKGFVYLYGSNCFNGGAFIGDLSDPWNPTYAGKYDANGYIHDGYVDNDTLFAAHIYVGNFEVVDMTNKAAGVSLATIQTPTNFTHNVWLSNNKKTIFTTDENTNSFLASYDISNLGNITELDRYRTKPSTNSIVHNTHIIQGDWAVSSWYTEGFTIADVSHPNNMIEVGKYDTYSGTSTQFEGAWGVYPFFPSGTIVVSNIDGGLYVLTPTYVKACYLEGTTKDSITGNILNGVNVSIVSQTNTSNVSANGGTYATGLAAAGTYSVLFTKTGYQSRTINNVSLTNGVTTILDVKLLANGVGLNYNMDETNFLVPIQNPSTEEIKVKYFVNDLGTKHTFALYTISGDLVYQEQLNSETGIISISTDLSAGIYFANIDGGKSVKLIKE